MWRRILAIGLVVIVLGGLLWFDQWRAEPRTTSGRVDADEIRVGSRVGGRTLRVVVKEGQTVEAGELLVELDPFDLDELRAEASYRAAVAEAQLAERRAGYRAEEIAHAKARRDEFAATLEELVNGPREQEISTARAELDLATARRELARATHGRVMDAFTRGAATQSEVDQAVESLKVADATVVARHEALALLVEGARPERIAAARAQLEQAEQQWQQLANGYRPEEIAQAEAARDAAAAALRAIDRQVEELRIRAPVASVVEAVDLEPGDIVPPNAPALLLLDKSRLWVRAYVPDTAADLQVGDALWVTADALPEDRFRGHVVFIAREAEFTPRNVQTPEERSKQVFRIKVELDEGLDRLRPGMFVDVHLDQRPGNDGAAP